MDQGGQGRDQVDPPVMPYVRGQRRATSASCARLQSRQLPAIGAKVVSHGRYIAFQMAEVAIPRNLFADILRLIAELRPPPDLAVA